MKTEVIGAQNLLDGQSLSFEISKADGKGLPAFVVRHEGKLSAFINKCAHVPVPLDFDDNDFMPPKLGLIQCKLHGALFRPEDGHCVSGPCAGKGLEQLILEEIGDKVYASL